MSTVASERAALAPENRFTPPPIIDLSVNLPSRNALN